MSEVVFYPADKLVDELLALARDLGLFYANGQPNLAAAARVEDYIRRIVADELTKR